MTRATLDYPPPVPNPQGGDVDTVLLRSVPQPEAEAAAQKLHQLFAHGDLSWGVLSAEQRRWWLRAAALTLAAARDAASLQ